MFPSQVIKNKKTRQGIFATPLLWPLSATVRETEPAVQQLRHAFRICLV